jgi:hypothetical protein
MSKKENLIEQFVANFVENRKEEERINEEKNKLNNLILEKQKLLIEHENSVNELINGVSNLQIIDNEKLETNKLLIDEQSLLIAHLLYVQREQLLINSEKKVKPRLVVTEATEEQLKQRILEFNTGVDVNKWIYYKDMSKWTWFDKLIPRDGDNKVGYSGWVCLELGEIMNKDKVLVGFLHYNRVEIKVSDVLNSPRGAIILTAAGFERPTITHTIDHKISSQIRNDSIENIRWATRTEQNLNQRKRQSRTIIHEIREGKILPKIEKMPTVFVTTTGMFKFLHGKNKGWRTFKESDTRINYSIGIFKTRYSIHRLVMMSFLRRELNDGEDVDHIDGDFRNNNLNNLTLISNQANSIRSKSILMVSIYKNVHTVYYIMSLAAEKTGIISEHISNSLRRTNPLNSGYKFIYADEKTIELFCKQKDKFLTYTDEQISEYIEKFKESSYYEVMKIKHKQNIEMKNAHKIFNEIEERSENDKPPPKTNKKIIVINPK